MHPIRSQARPSGHLDSLAARKYSKILVTVRSIMCYSIPSKGEHRATPSSREHIMATKTIDTNKYGKVDIRRTSEKVSVYFPFMGFGRNYTRVAWEDTNACYWVKVDGYWYKTYRRIGEGYKADSATIGFDA